MPRSIVMATAATAELEPAPIPPDWILGGTPEARSKTLARSHDTTTHIVAWDCTPGRFTWQYSRDETLVVVSGEAFITTANGAERRLGPGEMAFFPAGTSCTWRVTSQIRKVAIVRQTMLRPLGFALSAWGKLLRMTGLAGGSPLMHAFFLASST